MCSSVGLQSVVPAVEMAALIDAQAVGVARMAELTAAGVLREVPVQVVTQWSEVLLRTADRVSAVATSGVGVVVGATTLIAGRYVSPRRWIEHTTHTSGSHAAAVVALAADVSGDYTRVGQSWLAGEITTAATRELTLGVRQALKAVPSGRRDVERDAVLDTLLPLARRESVADLHRVVKGLRFVLDPDGATQAALDAYDEQALRVTVSGAIAQISMWTTTETAAALLTVLDQQISTWFRDGAIPGEEPRTTTGEVSDPGEATATAVAAAPVRHRREHLLALAFGETITSLLDRGMVGSRHGVAAHLNVTVDVDRYAAGLGADLHIPGMDDPVLLPNATLARILCDASIIPAITTRPRDTNATHGSWSCPGPADLITLLHDTARTVLYVGRSQRSVTPRQRRALEIRDRHCAFPGCRIDASRTTAHHVKEWFAENGPTDLDNLVLLCSKHHHAVHEGRWRITATPGHHSHTTGYWQFTPPERAPERSLRP